MHAFRMFRRSKRRHGNVRRCAVNVTRQLSKENAIKDSPCAHARWLCLQRPDPLPLRSWGAVWLRAPPTRSSVRWGGLGPKSSGRIAPMSACPRWSNRPYANTRTILANPSPVADPDRYGRGGGYVGVDKFHALDWADAHGHDEPRRRLSWHLECVAGGRSVDRQVLFWRPPAVGGYAGCADPDRRSERVAQICGCEGDPLAGIC
jgi:hypothetical protein